MVETCFEISVKELMAGDSEFETALKNNDADNTERIAKEKLLAKPKYYFSLESLRQAYQTSNGLVDFLRKAGGYIEKLPDKYDRMNQGFEEFKLVYSSAPYEKLNYFENIYQCYLTSPEYRLAIAKGNLGVLDDQTFGGNVPIGQVNRAEVKKVVDYIKESKIACVN